jgi:hypothetical protein
MYFEVKIEFANTPQSHEFFQKCSLRSIEQEFQTHWKATKVPVDAPEFELPWYYPVFSWVISPDWVHYADPRVSMKFIKRISPMVEGKVGLGKPIITEVAENIHLDFCMQVEDMLVKKIRELQNTEKIPSVV